MTRIVGNLAGLLREPILPCPCCAGVTLFVFNHVVCEVEIECSSCNLQMTARLASGITANLADCVARWNRRAVITPPDVELVARREPPNFVNQVPAKAPTPKEIPTTNLTNDEHWFTQIELDEFPNKQVRKK